MFGRLFERLLPPTLSEPAVWGKLPAYGDFTHQNAHPEDMAAWQDWFLRHPLAELAEHSVPFPPAGKLAAQPSGWINLSPPKPATQAFERPWCFVLPASALTTAPHIPGNRLIAGVMARSCDNVGRLNPMVVWHAMPRDAVAYLKDPFNWLYWLSRLVELHTPPVSTPDLANQTGAFLQQLNLLWQQAAPSFSRRPAWLRKSLPDASFAALLAEATPSRPRALRTSDDEANGVRQVPWHRWPETVAKPETNGGQRMAYFWQQAGNGEYIGLSSLAVGWNGA